MWIGGGDGLDQPLLLGRKSQSPQIEALGFPLVRKDDCDISALGRGGCRRKVFPGIIGHPCARQVRAQGVQR
jgi:hypothetical protein